MSEKVCEQIDAVLAQVSPTRRQLLKQLLVGTSVAALATPSSIFAADAAAHGEGPQGKGKGAPPFAKGKGDVGEGKGKGKGDWGKGKGKGKGPGGGS